MVYRERVRKDKKGMIIYLAGAISGKSYNDVLESINERKKYLEKVGYDVLNPMTGKAYLRNEKEFVSKGYDNPTSTNHAIVERDRWMVKRSDIILVDLMNATEKSIGSIMELAWAHDNGVHSIVVMPKDGHHNHAFVLEAADIVFNSTEDALNYLVELKNGD
jgi:nucleoside 2-deoxyribosyltransferase